MPINESDSLEQGINKRINQNISNNSKRTLCIKDTEVLGIVDELLEFGSIYQLREDLDALICSGIIDYAKFEDDSTDALSQYNIEKVAYFIYQEKIAKKYKKKTSQKQEKTLAKKLKGKITPGSGAYGFHKGDVKSAVYLVEAKYTDSLEYRLTLQTWNKIKNEAYTIDKIPLMEVVLDQSNEPVKLIIIAPIDLHNNFNMSEEQFVNRFYSLPVGNVKSKSKSALLKKDILKNHIEEVNYNHENKLPSFLIVLGTIMLIGLETEDFSRMLKDNK